MTHIHKRTWLTWFSLLALISLIVLISTQPKLAFANNTSGTTEELSHEKVIFLTEQFMNTILQDIDEEYKVTNVESKERLLKEFEKVATKEVAQPYVDYYFDETEDGLYILPTETPEWFNSNNDYDMIQKENKAIITQYNESHLHGDYTIEMELTYKNDEWLITNVDLI